MSKQVWISMLVKDEAAAKGIYQKVKEFGLNVQGHFWKDDLENLDWFGPAKDLSNTETGLWIIYGTKEVLAKESIKQGLSLLTLAVKEKRQGMISTIILCDQDIAKEDLPSLLRQSIIFKPDKPGLGAKITAKANLPDKRKINEEYRLNCYALPKVGLWLEVGPYEVDWNGILFGVSGAGIEAMGVGKMGEIPEKSVLKYPIRDMHLSLGGNKYTAWGSQNVLSREDSAYFKVKGTPDSLVFGAFEPENNNPELFKFSLI